MKDNYYEEAKMIKKLNNQLTYLINEYTNLNAIDEDANLILNYVWLGNYHVAHDFNFVVSAKIKYIINATTNVSNKFNFVDYTNFIIEDEDACHENLLNMINYGADVINEAIKEKQSILVHCKKGHHRSATIIVFYLMKYKNMPLIDAVCLIKKIRPNAFKRMTCMLRTLIYYECMRIQVTKHYLG